MARMADAELSRYRMRTTVLEAAGSRILGELRRGEREGQGDREGRHREEWPRLWEALDDFIELVHESDAVSRQQARAGVDPRRRR